MPLKNNLKKKAFSPWLLFVISVLAVLVVALLLTNIMERRVEAVQIVNSGADVKPFESRNEKWAKNFPKQYEGWKATEQGDFSSKHNGSAMVDMLAVDPRMVILWAGYGFSKDYNAPRGHMHAVEDIHNTLRTGAPKNEKEGPMPATCWACKSPDVPRLMNIVGPKEFYKGKWAGKGHEINNPIGCADCHDEKTMKLKITRPALIEAFARQGKDIEKATHQDMRSLVCAQCHVEYYFKGEGKELTFPWDKGTSVEEMEAYYDEIDFSDWTHKLSRAPMLKAQHPGYEIHQKGIHGQRGVSCADCHMPYKTEGGQKFTDHHIQSPLNNVNNSCQVCHREDEGTLMNNVYERQDKILETREELEKMLVSAHIEAAFAWEKGAKEEVMKPALMHIRHAQWRWDYAAASHGGSFHAPIEMARVISTGMHKAQDARLLLARILADLGHNKPVPMPDIVTKEKAQAYIGFDEPAAQAAKDEFIKTVVPEWKKKAAERENAE